MKKIKMVIFLCLVASFCFSYAYAEEGVPAKGIYVETEIKTDGDFLVEDAVFSLYDTSGKRLGEASFEVNNASGKYEMYFDIEYKTGDKFLLELTKGMKGFMSYDKLVPVYHNTLIEPYAYLDEDGNVQVSDRFYITCIPNEQKNMDVYINHKMTKDIYPIKLIDGVVFCEMNQLMNYLYMPPDAISVDGDTVTVKKNDEYIIAEVGKHTLLYDDGTEYPIGTFVRLICDKTYLPMKPYCEKFGLSYTEYISDFAYDVNIEPKYMSDKEKYIFDKGIKSSTDYLIWISKKDYKLNLFKGTDNNFRLINSYPCTIGAYNTPTITGEFEYHEKIDKWYYPNYYVGPVMRFYKGYAIHTVLLKNDGTEYDGRVGMRLSLGCVRVKKDVMEYLVKEVPMNTKVYITP